MPERLAWPSSVAVTAGRTTETFAFDDEGDRLDRGDYLGELMVRRDTDGELTVDTGYAPQRRDDRISTAAAASACRSAPAGLHVSTGTSGRASFAPWHQRNLA